MNNTAITPEDAFEVLQVAVQKQLAVLQQAGADAMRAGDLAKAQQTLDQVRALHEMLGKIEALEAEFKRLVKIPERRADYGQLHEWKKTAKDKYYRFILQALVTLGGSADADAVLEVVFAQMRHKLNEHDLAMLPGSRDMRWRNTAMWARYELVQQGLMRNDSPFGTWEITDEGRRWLERQGWA